MREKKAFFVEPTVGEIKRYDSITEIPDNLIERIQELTNDEAGIITTGLIPESYTPRKFMKHGRIVPLRRFRSLEEAIEMAKTPIQLRELTFDSIRTHPYSGLTFKPFVGTDKRTRKVSLVECVKGAKLYGYANQPETEGFTPTIDIHPYDESRRVVLDGTEVVLMVPSRIKGQERYEFKFVSVPVVDKSDKWGIAYNIRTTHTCKSKLFNIRYTWEDDRESSRLVDFCAHEIAGYLAIIDHYLNNKLNIIPLQMSQFPIPTQETVDFYERLTHNVLIQTDDDKKPRKLNIAEKEILLWGFVHVHGHDSTFYAREKVKEYTWRKSA